MTQTQLAHALSASERNIHRWESGQNAPQPRYVFALAQALGVHPSFFFTPLVVGGEESAV